MSTYNITCCSTCDLSLAHLARRDIQYVSFHFELDGNDYYDDFGQSVSPERLFREMDEGASTKTSQVGVGEYIAFFEPMLEAGKDILHVTLSSGISGTYNGAMSAVETLKEKYPDRRIYLVDSLAASSGYGLLMDKLADLRDEGMGIEELYQWTEEHKLELNHWFFTSDLTYFIRGGRVSKTSGFFGTMLKICPLLHVDYLGRLIAMEKVPGKKRVIKRCAEKMFELAENGADYSGKCYISHSMCEEDAKAVAALVEEHFPKLDGKVEIYPIGATIGSHTGPGTVALFFWGEKRAD